MTDSMMERVARAIAEKLAGREVSLGVPRIAPTGPVTITVDLVDVARAALQAIPLEDCRRWIETLADPDRWGPNDAARCRAALKFAASLSEDTKP